MPTDTDSDTATDSGGASLLDDVELVDVADLRPYVNNPKKHPDAQVDAIASSIRHYGFDQPIVVDGDGEIIKGHGRYEASKRLGLKRVPVIVREDLSAADARASRIADNKTAESAWHDDILLTEVEALQLDGYDAEMLGFSDEDEYDDLLGDWTDDDLTLDDLGDPGDDVDTSMTLDYDRQADYDDVVDFLNRVMAHADVDDREAALLWLCANAPMDLGEWDMDITVPHAAGGGS